MSKELEALDYLEEEIKNLEIKLEKNIKLRDKLTIFQHRDLENCFSRISKYESKLKQLNILKQALKRLETIDNAEPSEALEALQRIKEENCEEDNSIGTIYYEECNIIKQALIKAEKEHKALEIIKKKSSVVWLLCRERNYTDFQITCENRAVRNNFTEEEFNFLKEVLKDE